MAKLGTFERSGRDQLGDTYKGKLRLLGGDPDYDGERDKYEVNAKVGEAVFNMGAAWGSQIKAGQNAGSLVFNFDLDHPEFPPMTGSAFPRAGGGWLIETERKRGGPQQVNPETGEVG
jgi:uncharacterized protein (DUF736 family)